MANTDPNIESFNSCTKRDFTLRKKISVIGTINRLQNIIAYYSNHQACFTTTPKLDKKYMNFLKILVAVLNKKKIRISLS